MLRIASEKSLSWLLSAGSFFITVFVLAGTVSDPVNSTKFLILGGVSIAAAFICFSSGWEVIKSRKLLIFTSVIFLFASINSILSSESPIEQNLYGTYGRNTGFLTYLFLFLVLIASSTLSQKKSFVLIIGSLILSGIVNVIYCLYVLTFGDFIGWNNPYGNILGTFGNPNFIGAFLGFFTAAMIAFALSNGVSIRIRLLTLLITLISIFEIIRSHAIQGRVVLAAGLAIVGFYLIRSKFKSTVTLVIYSTGVFIVGLVSLLGALQIGPLTRFIYKTSVSLRGEYWQAGLNMAKDHLLTGVGFDAYGDWYRRARDSQALILPGPETVTNAAHNVPIDVFAFGGVPLLIPYLMVVVMVVVAIARHTNKNREYDGIFVALTTAWLGYQIQSIISINQIGLAIWGWLLGGAILAYTAKKQSVSKKATEQIFSPQLIGSLGMVVGLIMACPPISADAKFQSALKAAQVPSIESALTSTYLTPTDTNRLLNAVQIFEQNKLFDLSYKYAKMATEFNPGHFDSWRALSLINNSSPEEKIEAKKRMILLDPLNKNLKNLP